MTTAPPLPPNARILIIKLSAVGDVIHALPVLDALRTALPEAHIAWAVHGGAAGLLQDHPQLNEVIVLPRRRKDAARHGGWAAVLRRLRGQGQGWDVALDLQGLTKSGAATWLSGARRRIGFAGRESRELNAWFMTQRHPAAPGADILGINLGLLAPLGIATPAEPRAVIVDRPGDRQAIDQWARALGVESERFIILDPFAGWPTKTWPREHWGEMARQLHQSTGLRVLYFFGPGERHEAEELAKLLRREYDVPGLLGPDTTLGEAAALLRHHAALFVGGDTGPAHLAAALGIPAIMMYGPSSSARNAPRFAGSAIQTLEIPGHPCSGTFRRTCPMHDGPEGCMRQISPVAVADAALKLWQEHR